MNIYCAGPIRGNTEYRTSFIEIVRIIKSFGHTALTELNSDFGSSTHLSDAKIFERDINWIHNSKLLIAEISAPSLGVGFEISYALYTKKIPVLALINGSIKNPSAMIAGCNSPLLSVKKYSEINYLVDILAEFINKYMEP